VTDQPTIVAAAETSQQDQAVILELGAPLRLLFSSILHELNQPLVAIRLCADSGCASCESGTVPAEKLRALFEAVSESADLTLRTIGRLRGIVQGQAPTISPTDVNQAVSEVLRLAQVVASSRGISLVGTLEPDLGCIWADRGALQQAILNLVFNAIEAIDQESERRVSVSTRCAGDAIEIVVADTGCGIVAEHQHRLFEPEFTTKPQGSGLGLGIALDIVLQHGGSLSLLRSRRGEGSSFCVSMPVNLNRVVEQALPPTRFPTAARSATLVSQG
jgi:signal transduction histidine kinase